MEKEISYRIKYSMETTETLFQEELENGVREDEMMGNTPVTIELFEEEQDDDDNIISSKKVVT